MLLAKKVFPTPAEMGIWSLFLSIISLTETIKQGLLRNPMIKFLSEPEYQDQKNKVQSSSLITNIVFTLVIVFSILCFGAFFSTFLKSPELYPLIMWGTIILLLLIPFNHFEVLLQANFKFKHIFIGYLLRQGVFVCSIIFLLIFFKGSVTLVTLVKLQIMSLSLGTTALFFGARMYFKKGFDIDKILMLRMFHFGKYIFGTNVFAALSSAADQFITSPMLGPLAVSYYNLVSRITTMIDVPSVAVADVLFPKNVEAMALSGTDKVRYYFERMVGTIISILLPVSLFIFIFPSLVIEIISSSKYLAAVPVLQCIILFSFVRPVSYQFGATMDAIGKPQYNFWVNLYTMIICLAFIYFGLKYFGFMGAVYGEIASIFPTYIVIYLILKKTVNVSFRNVFKYVWMAYADAFIFARNFIRK
jgi:lipopolysaccharide exporter